MPAAQESVVASLHELRAIEQQRIADELAARLAREAEVAAARYAAEAQREAEARAARDAALADAARREAEAEAARRAHATAIACAEATERARAEAELEAARYAEEIRLRHEQVARTRPHALLAVIAALVIGGGALAALIVHQRGDLADQEAAIAQTRARADQLARERDAREHAAAALQDEIARRDAALAVLQGRVSSLQQATPPPAAPAPHHPAPHGVTPPPPPPGHGPIHLDAACADSVLCTGHP